jgi:FkbM family methyltransferase
MSKSTVKEFGFKKFEFNLGKYGKINYAQWLHPCEGKKIFDEKLVDMYSKYVRKGMVAIDIGAHTGDSTLPIAVACNSIVYAFEPNPYVYKILKENINLNEFPIVPIMQAITEKEKKYVFRYNDDGFCNGGLNPDRYHSCKLEVDGITFNSFLTNHNPEQIGFIKIDAEGYDLDILKQILSPKIDRPIPAIQIEIIYFLDADKREEIWKLANNNGYDVFKKEDFRKLNFEDILCFEKTEDIVLCLK